MSGNHERRGYSLHLTPVKIEKRDGYSVRSFTISADPKERGLKSFLLEVKAKSAKHLARAEEIAESRLNRVLNEWLSRSGCELVEPIPPHSIVGYSELGTILLTAAAPVPVEPKVDRAEKNTRLTKEELARLPALGSQENNPDPLVGAKWCQPWGGWTRYAYEGDGVEEFFGYVVGLENELGYFHLSELRSIKGPMGLTIERDIHWKPTPLSVVRAKHGDAVSNEVR